MKINIKALLSICLAWSSLCLSAQEEIPGCMNSAPAILRPVTSTYVIGMGGSQLADTYLTPLIYNGWSSQFQYSRMQAMKFCPDNWVMQLNIGLNISRGNNYVRNATMWQASFNADWAMMRRWKLPCQVTIGMGGYTGINAGAMYHQRNGNNPAQAKASWNLGVRAFATYPFHIGKIPVLARWQGTLPVTGFFFAPQYGELYYEIYLGNEKGLFHGAWFGNYFGIDNDVTLDFGFGSNWLRVGYRSEVLSTHVNNLTSRMVSNSFIIGISGEWISVGKRSYLNPQARIISALY